MLGFSGSDGSKLKGLLALRSSCKGIGSASGPSAAWLTDFGLETDCLPATLMPTGFALMCEEKGRPAFAAASRALAVAARSGSFLPERWLRTVAQACTKGVTQSSYF